MQSQKLAIISTITALLLVISAVSTLTPENASAYQKNQATSQTGECGNEFIPINTGCQNTDSQIQGDENVVALTAQQTFPEVKPTPPPNTAILTVFKKVECTSEVQNEFPDLCEPSAFTMNVQSANNPDPISFLGSDTGTPVSLKSGPYEVVETSGLPDEIELVVGVSPDCKGVIEAGQKLTCTFTNSLAIISPSTCEECLAPLLDFSDAASDIASAALHLGNFDTEEEAIAAICEALENGDITIDLLSAFLSSGVFQVDPSVAENIIECLDMLLGA